MRKPYFLIVLFFVSSSFAQPAHYTVADAHSHNDYEQKVPFWTAYDKGFGSIEEQIVKREKAVLKKLAKKHNMQVIDSQTAV